MTHTPSPQFVKAQAAAQLFMDHLEAMQFGAIIILHCYETAENQTMSTGIDPDGVPDVLRKAAEYSGVNHVTKILPPASETKQ